MVFVLPMAPHMLSHMEQGQIPEMTGDRLTISQAAYNEMEKVTLSTVHLTRTLS